MLGAPLKIKELVETRDAVLAPALDIPSAIARWGAVLRWTGEMADLEATDPFQSVVLERFEDRLAGMQFTWSAERSVGWAELLAAFGKAEERMAAWDDWGGPTPFRFKSGTGNFPRAYLLLSVARREGERASLRSMIVRRRLVELPR